jgi:hypothetical protein
MTLTSKYIGYWAKRGVWGWEKVEGMFFWLTYLIPQENSGRMAWKAKKWIFKMRKVHNVRWLIISSLIE